MESQNIETENQATPAVAASCRKYASDDNATFLENMKGHFNEFVNSSMEEHKTCFKNTMDKILSQSSMMFERLKAVEEKKVEAKEVVESHASLQEVKST